jgi:hypothetical protein
VPSCLWKPVKVWAVSLGQTPLVSKSSIASLLSSCFGDWPSDFSICIFGQFIFTFLVSNQSIANELLLIKSFSTNSATLQIVSSFREAFNLSHTLAPGREEEDNTVHKIQMSSKPALPKHPSQTREWSRLASDSFNHPRPTTDMQGYERESSSRQEIWFEQPAPLLRLLNNGCTNPAISKPPATGLLSKDQGSNKDLSLPLDPTMQTTENAERSNFVSTQQITLSVTRSDPSQASNASILLPSPEAEAFSSGKGKIISFTSTSIACLAPRPTQHPSRGKGNSCIELATLEQPPCSLCPKKPAPCLEIYARPYHSLQPYSQHSNYSS